MNLIRTLLTAVLAAGLCTPPAHAADACTDGWMMRMRNADFEEPFDGSSRIPGWCVEGPMSAGIDQEGRFSRSGARNSYLQTATAQWNGMSQLMALPRSNDYCIELIAQIRTMGPVTRGEFGLRMGRSGTVWAMTTFTGSENGYKEARYKFRPGTLAEGTVFIGHRSPTVWTRLMVDDLAVIPRYAPAPAACG